MSLINAYAQIAAARRARLRGDIGATFNHLWGAAYFRRLAANIITGE